jgi:hypothetical protein
MSAEILQRVQMADGALTGFEVYLCQHVQSRRRKRIRASVTLFVPLIWHYSIERHM